ncbi:hypothetical protein DL96DRAFT_1781009 [Flagelloscypha sp. PMI_526]|nr:hypothetical protein DL96DRAFT_1781009 [Flagelloscypha sp. PMI_526]
MSATRVTTLVLHNITSERLFSMLSGDPSSYVLFPSLRTLCLRGTTTMFATALRPDFTTALAGRSFYKVPVHRLVIENPADTSAHYHMLLNLQHIQELIVNGILHLVDEEGDEEEAEFTDPGSDSDGDNGEWGDFWEYEGDTLLWQSVCDHVSEDEDI